MAKTNLGVTRRGFLKTAAVAGGFALLGSGLGNFILGPRPAEGEEIPTIEGLTGGQIKVGDTITKDNVELVKHFVTPGTYEKVVKYGMEMPIYATTTEPTLLVPERWLEVTERNRGKAILDKNGQLWTKDGKPWIGGFPFPEPKTGLEVIWNMASFSWLEYADDFVYPGGEYLIKEGEIYRTFEYVYAGIGTVGRVYVAPKPYYPGHEDELYRLIIRYTKPFDYKGTAILIVRPYDQTKLERAYGYLPALRRVRELSTKQRWESAAGNDIFRSDQNGHNDPLSSWEWKLLEKRPMLMTSVSEGYQVDRFPVVAGRFPRGRWELRPEVYVMEATPKDPWCPYGKKILYVDGVMRKSMIIDFYDRQGRIWKAAAYFYARIHHGKQMIISHNHPHHCLDLQADHVTYLFVDERSDVKNLGKKIGDLWTEEAMLEAAY